MTSIEELLDLPISIDFSELVENPFILANKSYSSVEFTMKNYYDIMNFNPAQYDCNFLSAENISFKNLKTTKLPKMLRFKAPIMGLDLTNCRHLKNISETYFEVPSINLSDNKLSKVPIIPDCVSVQLSHNLIKNFNGCTNYNWDKLICYHNPFLSDFKELPRKLSIIYLNQYLIPGLLRDLIDTNFPFAGRGLFIATSPWHRREIRNMTELKQYYAEFSRRDKIICGLIRSAQMIKALF